MEALAEAPSARRVGRDGHLDLRFERREAATVVAACRYTLPLQVLAPLALPDPAAVVSMLNPTGGLLGGDRLVIDVTASAAAHGCLTTPSATKVYRTTGAVAEQEVTLRLEREATLEWVPDHTIPYAGSAFRQRICVDVADGARLVLVDAFAAGRIARGEAWRFAWLESAVSIRDARGWLFVDRFALRGDARWAGLGFADGHPYFATIAVIGERCDRLCRDIADAGTRWPDATAAAALLPRRGVVVRVLAASAPALLGVVETVWAAGRSAMLGLPPLALRKL